MRAIPLAAVVLATLPCLALAQEDDSFAQPPTSPNESRQAIATGPVAPLPPATPPKAKAELRQTWVDTARFFVGGRTGVGVPPGGDGVAPTAGVELGVSADSGLGFGLHFVSVWNPPDAPTLRIPKAQWALGAAADMRWYFQTVRPLSLYPTLSVGFLAGPGTNGKNAVLPMLNPGFGARIRVGNIYTSFEFGVIGFHVPFIAVALGWEPSRERATHLAAD